MWKNEIRGKGQRFTSADAFRYSMWKYAIAHQFDYKLQRNCKQRIVVKYKIDGCRFRMCKGSCESGGDDSERFQGGA